MSQRILDVTLADLENADTLIFHLDPEEPDAYTVNLNNATSQIELKKVFTKLLQLLLEEEITLRLIVADGYKQELYQDVCIEYINDLNRELEQVRKNMETELS